MKYATKPSENTKLLTRPFDDFRSAAIYKDGILAGSYGTLTGEDVVIEGSRDTGYVVIWPAHC